MSIAGITKSNIYGLSHFLKIKDDGFDYTIEAGVLAMINSLANEVGCHQFDITQDLQNPTKIFLYELYGDAAAFDLHTKASHYLEFNQLASEMITAKSVRLLKKISH